MTDDPRLEQGNPEEAEANAPDPEPDGPKNDPIPEDDAQPQDDEE